MYLKVTDIDNTEHVINIMFIVKITRYGDRHVLRLTDNLEVHIDPKEYERIVDYLIPVPEKKGS